MKKSRDDLTKNFIPTFVDELSFNSSINSTCNGLVSCIIDFQLTGLEAVGQKTLQNEQALLEIGKLNGKC